MPDIRVTKTYALTEFSGVEAIEIVTKAFVLSEILEDETDYVNVTKAFVLVELDNANIFTSKAFILVEIKEEAPYPVRTEGNVYVYFGGTELTEYLNSASLEAIVTELERDAVVGPEHVLGAGLTNWSITIAGFWNKNLDDLMVPKMLSNEPTNFTYGVGAFPNWVLYSWEVAYVERFQVIPGILEALRFEAQIMLSGQPVRSSATE